MRNSERLRFILWWWAPVVIYACGIVFLSSLSIPQDYLPDFSYEVSDKLLHGLEYGILGILTYRAIFNTVSPGRQPSAFAIAMLAVMMFGVTDEFHQFFVPSREVDGWDWLADVIGAAVSVKIYQWIFGG